MMVNAVRAMIKMDSVHVILMACIDIATSTSLAQR